MGVTGLWTVVQPCARPIKIETLNKKRLAVDASIWVYQFLKAVRDKEGNALRNSHVVGFFRRLCKLLFFGIKPVFVFDGGAPTLKRQTITARKNRREGRREDAVRTAGKLLALQMQRHAEDEDQRRRDVASNAATEAPLPDNLVYVDELSMTTQERQTNRSFKKKDQYHLPQLEVPMSEMGGPNDPRVMSMEELEKYARQFDAGEDINVYDFSKIDFDSPFFTSLPAADRYNILNAARLRSRLRMGLSKDQLDKMFPNRMDFSRFQIERVRERNELTARLMNINNGDADWDITGRIAGEKGREYFLVKNSGVEGGWALGVVGDRDKEDGQESKPIDVDQEAKPINLDEESEAESVAEKEENLEDIERRRKAFYQSRQKLVNPQQMAAGDQGNDPAAGSMFVDDQVRPQKEERSESIESGEDSDLQRAIAMSLETDDKGRDSAEEEEEFERVFNPAMFQQKKAENFNPFSKSNPGHVAQIANNRARRAAPVRGLLQEESDGDFDLQGALAESRRSKRKSSPGKSRPSPKRTSSKKNATESEAKKTGPLPFEKLNLGASLLGKKRMDQIEEKSAGGFDRMAALTDDKKKPVAPLPPWFAERDIVDDLSAQRKQELEARKLAREKEGEGFEFQTATLRKDKSEIIDVDDYDNRKKAPILLESSDEDEEPNESASLPQQSLAQDDQLRMGDIAEKVLLEPLVTGLDEARGAVTEPQSTQTSCPAPEAVSELQAPSPSSESELEWEESDHDGQALETRTEVPRAASTGIDNDDLAQSDSSSEVYMPPDLLENAAKAQASQDESAKSSPEQETRNEGPTKDQGPAEVESEEDEDSADEVYIPPEFLTADSSLQSGDAQSSRMHEQTEAAPVPASGTANQSIPVDDDGIEAEDDYSDPEEEELMVALANEAEEHARFASQLNNKTQQQNIEEYERELKALRTQQKKDRRDADEVTQIMISECQQLLKLFGLPYITAPMEAEAQCAELVRLGLVDGIVTDDSDTFLFGGTRVYKNMFNQAKFVECYLSTDLEKEFDLTRDKLINIAHLLGSDYTEGLPGIGPVNALEIIGEFPDLRAFKDWWSEVQSTTKPAELDNGSAFRKKFRRANGNKLFLPNSFPDLRVNEAYHQPEVDSDPSPFQWGVPDLDALRSFLMATIGWGQDRTDEVLVPVIRDMNRREAEGTQANITNFINGGTGAGAFAPRVRDTGKSKRMEGALSRMAEKARSRRRAELYEEAEAMPEDVEMSAVAAEDAVIAVPGSAAASTELEARQRKEHADKKKKKNKRAAPQRAKPTTAAVASDDDDNEQDEHDDDSFEPPAKKRKAVRGSKRSKK